MAKLIYGMGGVTLDGYVAGRDGSFDWGDPGDDLHLHAGAELAAASMEVYGRKMYDLMVFWEAADEMPEMNAAGRSFAKSWQGVDKLVVSKTLTEPRSKRTRLVSSLSVDEMRKLKAEATKPIAVAGPTTAAPFLNAGLVDEVSGYFMPLIVGGGLPMFKDLQHSIQLELIEEQPLDGGFIFRRYSVKH